jgi:GntR family transcriptional repressor for pyruvate dehydrogenase complex
MMQVIKPIKHKTISDRVFDELSELIRSGELKPGSRIMTERELAEAFGVCRGTIREAIKKLAATGLLEQRQGRGTFVSIPKEGIHHLSIHIEAQDISLGDMFEIYSDLECVNAAYAAKRAVGEDIEKLTKHIEEMNKEVESGELGMETDAAFHMAISYAAKNPLRVNIMRRYYDLIFHNIGENPPRSYRKNVKLEKILSQHTKIRNAINKHDPNEAYRCMQRHIDFMREFLPSD